jgi:hypothetical protein
VAALAEGRPKARFPGWLLEELCPRQVNFVKRQDFLRFLKDQPDTCFKAAEQLSDK